MAEGAVEVGVVVVAYNGRAHIDECLTSLRRAFATEPLVQARVVMVDNASTDGTAGHVAAHYPWVELLEAGTNLGFTGGNNAGWGHLRRHYPSLQYLMLLNQDAVVEHDSIRPLVEFLQNEPSAAAAQPLITLYDESDLINTAGTVCHYLGYASIGRYRDAVGAVESPVEIQAFSGAACLIRCRDLEASGIFEDCLFMYCEDVDLSFKLRERGHALWLVPSSRVRHKYSFTTPSKAYYYLERNRWWLLLTHYQSRTLLLVAPAFLAMELGQWLFAAATGNLAAKARACAWWSRPSVMSACMRARRAIQSGRIVADRDLMRDWVGRVPWPGLEPRALTVANTGFATYWRLIRPWLPASCPTVDRGGRARRAALAGIAFQMVVAMAQFAILAILFRAVGVRTFGFWITAASVAMWASLVELGTAKSLVSWLSRDPGSPRAGAERTGLALAITATLCGGLSLAVILSSPFVHWHQLLQAPDEVGPGLVTATVIAAIVVAQLGYIAGVSLLVLLARHRGDAMHAAGIVSQVIGVVAVCLLAWAGAPLWSLGGALMAPPLIAGLIGWWVIARLGLGSVAWPRGRVRRVAAEVLRLAVRFLAADLCALALLQSGPLLLAWSRDSHDVAVYTAAYRPAALLMAIFFSVSQAYWPAFGDAAVAGDRTWVRSGFATSLRLIGLLWLCGGAGVLLFGRLFIRAWLGPEVVPDWLTLLASLLLAGTYGLWLSSASLLNGLGLVGRQALSAVAALALIGVAGYGLGRGYGPAGVFVAQSVAAATAAALNYAIVRRHAA